MAGGNIPKYDPKKQAIAKSQYSPEVIKDNSYAANQPPKKFSLSGILGLGQTVEIGKPAPINPEHFYGTSHLEREQQVLYDQKQKEIQKAIQELREEIRKLTSASVELDKSAAKTLLQPIPETNEYQLTFLSRIRNFIANVRKNISEASCWLDSFSTRKKKRNFFWNMSTKNKKGGQQYMFSEEHSVARSVG